MIYCVYGVSQDVRIRKGDLCVFCKIMDRRYSKYMKDKRKGGAVGQETKGEGRLNRYYRFNFTY